MAFACTLQRDGVPTKIRSDVEKICGGGVRVETIYCFLVVALPVGVRHTLQEEVSSKRGVHLEIFDLHAIAELLTDRAVFWIAEQYLSLPASLAPASKNAPTDGEELPSWYVDDRARWRERGSALATLGQLLDLRDGLRHATFHLSAREDLPFWLGLMEPLCGATGRVVRQRARYETAVAQLRGMRDLRPVDRHVADFFGEMSEEDDPARLEDAGVLLTYASVAWSFAHSDLTLAALTTWSAALRERVEALLVESPPPVRRARLLEVVGQLCLARDPTSMTQATEPIELPEISELVDDEGRPRRPLDVPASQTRLCVDLDRGLEAWTELTTSLEEIPLFPVDSLARHLELLSPLLVDQPSWPQLVEGIDAALARAEGDAAAADLALGRALALSEGGRRLDALEELHKAKVRFFHGDHARSIASTLLALADLYGQLHLPQAARQHALAAATAARASGTDEVAGLVAHGLLMASSHDYRAGNFVSALQTVRVGLIAQHALVDEEVDQWAEHDFSRALMTAGVSYNAAHDLLNGPLVEKVDALLAELDLLGRLTELRADMNPWTETEWASLSDDQLDGRPFDDLGAMREVRFSALGLTWQINCTNEFSVVAAAERLAAAAQILCADLGKQELLLLPVTIRVEVFLRAGSEAEVEREPPVGPERVWRVPLTPVDETGTLDPEVCTQELLAVLVPMLLDASLLSPDQFTAEIERSFAGGITHKVCPVRPYDELIPYGPANLEGFDLQSVEPPLRENRPPARCNPDLAWRDGTGPGFSAEIAREMLETRYQQLPELMPITLRALRDDRRFATVVSVLRTRGWLDWHILTAIFNLVLQVRLGHVGLNTTQALATEAGRAATRQLVQTPEADSDPPVALAPLLNVERLDTGRTMALGSLMVHWGLDLHAGDVDLGAAERLLAARYGYWRDDIDHDDPFKTR